MLIRQIKRVGCIRLPCCRFFSLRLTNAVGKILIGYLDMLPVTAQRRPSGIGTFRAWQLCRPKPRYTFNTHGNIPALKLTAKCVVGCSGTKLRSIVVTAPPSPKNYFYPNVWTAPLNVTYTNQSPATKLFVELWRWNTVGQCI